MRGQPQLGITSLHGNYGIDEVLSGPFGPGRDRRFGENKMRYSRLLSTLWKCSSVEGFRTIAERSTRTGRMNRVHNPAMIRSALRRFGARQRRD